MTITSIYSGIKTGVKIYKLATDIVVDIYKELAKIYVDLARAHLKSAEQAFNASQASNNREAEVRSGINHLRDSYNIFSTALSRKKIVKGWFSSKEIPIPPPNSLMRTLINIATIIALSYKELGEYENAETWKKNAISNFDKYKKINLSVLKNMEMKKNQNIGWPSLPGLSVSNNIYANEMYQRLKKEGKEYAGNYHVSRGGTYVPPRDYSIIYQKGVDFIYSEFAEEEEKLNTILEKK